MATKLILVGSLYEFTELASNEVICDYRDAHEGPEPAPFFFFDASSQTFMAEVEQGDKETLEKLLARMSGYIENHRSNQFVIDDEPRIRPMEGTSMEELVREDGEKDNLLLEDLSDDGSEGEDFPESLRHLTLYWKPQNKSISMLRPMFAQQITRLTGASLYAEEGKRYRIIHGNFQLALEKLLRLEPLLERLQPESSPNSLFASGNVLIWPSNQKDCRIEFVRMTPERSSYYRVIVKKMENFLESKFIGELRVWDMANQQYETQEKFLKEWTPIVEQPHASRIWDDYIYPGFGNPSNMGSSKQPQGPSIKHNDAVPGENRISDWTQRVVPGANPEIAPEWPMEPVEPVETLDLLESVEAEEPTKAILATRRKVAVDSDSEDDEPSMTAPQNPLSIGGQPKPSTSVEVANHIDAVEQEDEDMYGPAQDISQPPGTVENAGFEASREVDRLQKQADMVGSMLENVPPVASGSANDIDNSLSVHIPEMSHTSPIISRGSLGDSRSPRYPAPSEEFKIGPPKYGWPSRGDPGRGNFRGRARNGMSKPGAGSHSNRHMYDSGTSRAKGSSHRGRNGRANANSNSRQQSTRASRGAGGSGHTNPSRPETLVDVREPATTRTPVTLPGLEAQIPLIRSESTSNNTSQNTSEDLLQMSDENAHGQSNVDNGRGKSNASLISASRELRFSDEGSSYIQTSIPKLNQNLLREKTLENAWAIAAAMQGQREKSSQNNKKAEPKQEKLHSTMRQKGRNPGRNSSTQETKAEKKARLAKVLDDAYSPIPPNGTQKPAHSPQKREEMSKWKAKQLSKQTPMAGLHPEIVEKAAREQQCAKLVSLLQPIFEAGRAFNGKLVFELSFGQVLVSAGDDITDIQFHDTARWSSVFEAKSGSPHSSTFTKILTTNGADIDRALESKARTTNGTSRLWSPKPGPQELTYEFSCRSRSNETFVIVVDQNGGYEVRKGDVAIGSVNLHVPAQVWDMSASLSGHLKWWEPPETVSRSVATFVDSLYVPPRREQAMIVFRQPDDHEIKIQSVIVRRTSYHNSTQKEYQGIQLKVSEAKNLRIKVHPEDKKLLHGYEGPTTEYESLARAGRIHYEMSLVHTGINQELARNESLEVGELTDEATTGKALLDRTTVRAMLDAAVQMVTRIDFVGLNNYGTLERLNDERYAQQMGLEARIGPSTHVFPKSAAFRTGTVASYGHVASQPIPGVRMNTIAEEMVDETGRRYRLGYGGARVPIPEEELGDVGDSSSRSQKPKPAQPSWVKSADRAPSFW